MYSLEYSNQFKKDFKKITKLPIADIITAGHVIGTLQQGQTLDARYEDHALVGDWLGFRECHIKPDLLLIYRIHDRKAIGSHWFSQ
ncbi:type II toxin-antitoxin system YafQ family toxin [Endozoicomonas acroporae]|uniref:type II toxin-antitoxin system YafQ family toxin n=1 Tax=Endozoicomonas acroporae TaxID=1701104 RepID=UPI001F51340E|nr:type II toxin-antitoxin system mRNA interferase toxin, RelE/StbE family [Endozoicomonas acroporae]